MPTYEDYENRVSTNVRNNNIKQQISYTTLNFFWKYMPHLSKYVVRKLFFSPASYRTRPIEEAYLKKSREFEIPVHEKRIKCWKWGCGPGILLAHGWNGRGIQLHAFIDPLVEAGYTVFLFDAPGHGRTSGKISSYFEYSDVIRTFFRHAGIFDIKGIIAHSLGASAVINGMEKENFFLDAVLISPALKLYQILYKSFLAYGFPIPILHALIHEFEEQFGYDLKVDNPNRLLSHISKDFLIVHDTHDRTIPYVDSLKASRQFSNITLHTTRGLGHKRALFDKTTIEFIIDHLCHKIESTPKINHEISGNGHHDRQSKKIRQLYISADFEKRLYLFLECPHLQKDFIAIEKHEADIRKTLIFNN
jgi:alpha-beta hydrolase superfamily lysophospholipase